MKKKKNKTDERGKELSHGLGVCIAKKNLQF